MWNEFDAKLTAAKWSMEEKLDGAKRSVKSFLGEERGDTNLITIIVVLVIVMALAVVFRKNIATLANSIWKNIFQQAGQATGGSAGSPTSFN